VLLSQNKSGFKLIDFGSATTVAVTPGVDLPVAIVDEELEKYTTMQVRHLRGMCVGLLTACSFAHQRWSICTRATASTPRLTSGYGVVWCGVVWCVVVWCGVVWCGVLWCVVVWCGVV
jgi:hypothetical protein